MSATSTHLQHERSIRRATVVASAAVAGLVTILSTTAATATGPVPDTAVPVGIDDSSGFGAAPPASFLYEASAALPNGHGAVSSVPSQAGTMSTFDLTGISDGLAFVLSEHFPDLSAYPEFEIAMGTFDRCRQISPISCD